MWTDLKHNIQKNKYKNRNKSILQYLLGAVILTFLSISLLKYLIMFSYHWLHMTIQFNKRAFHFNNFQRPEGNLCIFPELVSLFIQVSLAKEISISISIPD